MADFNALQAVVDDLTNWYWNFGRQRKGRRAIERSDWLNRLYEVRRTVQSLDREKHAKKSLALWGPSQVGKSTLLARYLDFGADADGNGSILQWDPSSPIRFENSAAHPNVTSINPYNFRSDASAFISRLSLRDSVAEPSFPVEVRLANRIEIAHALTIGWISDWKRNKATKLSDSGIKEIIEGLSKASAANSREGFQQVFEVAALAAQFSMSSIQDNPFDALTQASINEILNCTPVADGVVNCGLYGRILWGKDARIDGLFHDLLEFRKKVLALGRGTIRCCYKSTALLLDMASYPNATGGLDIEGKTIEANSELERELLAIGYAVQGDDVLLSHGSGKPLFANAQEFALFQGLIWEITLPVNRTTALKHQESLEPFLQLLEYYDVLDFPGVSNIGTGSEQLSDNVLAKSGDHLLFTHLLKMGKTSAMIAATTKAQIVDCFCLLLRTMSPLSRPGTLAEGLRSWKASLGQRSQPELHVLSTFFGTFFNDVVRNPNADHFTQGLSSIKALGDTIEGARFHPIVFGKYEILLDSAGRELTKETASEVIPATVERLTSHPQFQSLYQLSSDELGDVICQGGEERLLRELSSATGLTRQSLLLQLSKELSGQVMSLIEAVSPETSGNVDMQVLREWSERVQASTLVGGCFDQNACRNSALAVRHILVFDPERLPPIPTNLRVQPEKAAPYIDAIIAEWRERDIDASILTKAQIRNPVEKNRLLFSFSQRINARDTARWLIQHFGRVVNETLARKGRRYLAIHLTNLVSPRTEFVAPQDPFQKTIEFSIAESDPLRAEAQSSPDHQSIIAPFVALLARMENSMVTSTEPQPGDNEIVQIAHSFKDN